MFWKKFPILGVALVLLMSAFVAAPSAAQQSGYLQCVPFARDMSGIQIYGDAHTWWGQARGKYARGSAPAVGAVMAFKPHRNSRLGHVAYVSKIVDSRNILISHSNWSLINGRRGQIERNVPARDVSPNNDWSEVRVWYHQTGALGGTHWPLHGFIYKAKPGEGAAKPVLASAPAQKPVSKKPSQEFSKAFADTESWMPSEEFRKAFRDGFEQR